VVVLEIYRERHRSYYCNYWDNLRRSELFTIAPKANIITGLK